MSKLKTFTEDREVFGTPAQDERDKIVEYLRYHARLSKNFILEQAIRAIAEDLEGEEHLKDLYRGG